jgi:hypothetical protein
MGIFNFTKPNGEMDPGPDSLENEEDIAGTSQAASPEDAKAKAPQAAYLMRKDLGSFFNINIYDIFKHKPEYDGKREYEKGLWADCYTMKLNPAEMSIFNKVHVIMHGEKRYDLIFRSDECYINNDLRNFIDQCLADMGPDFMGKGRYTAADDNDVFLGAFSRFWVDKIRIDNVFFAVNLTMYNIQTT